jgi:hypothetical protein
MATYVNDLRLKEITTGDESGTWGTSTNTNLELIAEAFSYGTEVITTNADTHTTTIADGSTDPGRSLYLKYTGTLDSACTITIGPNTVSKVWIIENGTSGSQDIILSQGSGANITIPAGDTKVVYSDGAGAGAAFVDAFASLSVVDLKVQDDLTVTDDASIGGDATITGTLGVTGNITGTLATAAQPNITSVGTLTGFTSTGIDDNADATAITIDSSENVGIGVSSPSGVGGRIVEISSANTISELHITNSTSGSGSATGLTHILNGVDAYAYNRENGAYIFGSNNTERMRIDSSGNVGIGTSSPFANQILNTSWSAGAPYGTVLAVTGNNTNDANWGHLLITDSTTTTGSGGTLRFGTGSISADINPFAGIDGYSEGSNYGGLKFLTRPTGGSATERMRIDSSGNVGIGTDSPASQLHVDGNFAGPLVTIHNTGGASAAYAGLEVETSTTGTYVQRWLNAGSELARVAATGYLMIGTTSTAIGSSSGAGNEGVFLGGSLGNAIAVSNGGCLDLNRKTTNGTILEFRFNGSSVGSISSNANSLPSDRNFKKDIEDLNIGLDLITKLNPVSYNYKIDSDGTPKMYGLIAQDLEQSLEEVGVDKNSVQLLQHKPNDNEKESDYSLDYLKLTPILIKAIQEQQTIIESLEARITALES